MTLLIVMCIASAFKGVNHRRLQMMEAAEQEETEHVNVIIKGMDEPLRFEMPLREITIKRLQKRILNATDLPSNFRKRLELTIEDLNALDEAGELNNGATFHCRLLPRIGRRRTRNNVIDEAKMAMGGPEMMIYAQLNGMGIDERIPIELSIYATIGNLKDKIANQAALSHGQRKRLKITFAGIECNDPNDLLSDVGIGSEAMVHCHIEAMRGPPRTLIPLRDEDCYDATRDCVDRAICIKADATVKQKRKKRVIRASQLGCTAGCLLCGTPLGPCTSNADFAVYAQDFLFGLGSKCPLAFREGLLYTLITYNGMDCGKCISDEEHCKSYNCKDCKDICTFQEILAEQYQKCCGFVINRLLADRCRMYPENGMADEVSDDDEEMNCMVDELQPLLHGQHMD